MSIHLIAVCSCVLHVKMQAFVALAAITVASAAIMTYELHVHSHTSFADFEQQFQLSSQAMQRAIASSHNISQDEVQLSIVTHRDATSLLDDARNVHERAFYLMTTPEQVCSRLERLTIPLLSPTLTNGKFCLLVRWAFWDSHVV